MHILCVDDNSVIDLQHLLVEFSSILSNKYIPAIWMFAFILQHQSFFCFFFSHQNNLQRLSSRDLSVMAVWDTLDCQSESISEIEGVAALLFISRKIGSGRAAVKSLVQLR